VGKARELPKSQDFGISALDDSICSGMLALSYLTGLWVPAAALSGGRTHDQANLLEVLPCPLFLRGSPPSST